MENPSEEQHLVMVVADMIRAHFTTRQIAATLGLSLAATSRLIGRAGQLQQ